MADRRVVVAHRRVGVRTRRMRKGEVEGGYTAWLKTYFVLDLFLD